MTGAGTATRCVPRKCVLAAGCSWILPFSSATEKAKERGSSSEQKAEVVPVAASGDIVEWLAFPRTEDVKDQDDPGG
jgi:hypothetical protein